MQGSDASQLKEAMELATQIASMKLNWADLLSVLGVAADVCSISQLAEILFFLIHKHESNHEIN